MESGTLIFWLILLSVWSLVWKGIALWKAGRKNQLVWFVVLLIVNTAGILEILYIFIFSKMKSGNSTASSTTIKTKKPIRSKKRK